MENRKPSQELLATAPLWPLMLKLALPAVVAQLVNLLYNIVDRIYIGRMPETGQLAALPLPPSFWASKTRIPPKRCWATASFCCWSFRSV